MKEKKYWLSELQIIFIEKMLDKMDKGWSLYSSTTRQGLEDILDSGYYKDYQKEWLQNMREDYIGTFCTTTI